MNKITEIKGVTGCDMCGGKLATIRGRHPGDVDRVVCPTCLAETLDAIKRRIEDNYNRPQASE